MTQGVNVDEWYEQHFWEIEQMGVSRTELFHAIKEGMSQKEFVDGERQAVSGKKKVTRTPKVSAEVLQPCQPIKGCSDKQNLDMALARNAAQLATIQDLQKALRQIKRENAKLHDDLVRIRKQIKLLEKIVANVPPAVAG